MDVQPRDLAPFTEPRWRPYVERGSRGSVFQHDVGDPYVAGRIRRPLGAYGDIVGADARIVFPGPLLTIGLHSARSFAAALSLAYARWVTEEYLPAHPGDSAMLCLPVDDLEACLTLVRQSGDRSGVVGAFVTNLGFPQMVENRYTELYAEMQERGLVLAFHPHPVWRDPPFEIFDRYLPVWALGYPFGQCALLVNWLVHGLPERFPDLRCVFYEAGVCWLSFIAHRFDQEFLKRRIEAPLLRERPSHYMRRYHFGTQPLDQADDPRWLQAPVRLIGPDRFVYASAFPQWDFDAPQVVERLSFLTPDERAGVLGGNAAALFGLPVPADRLAPSPTSRLAQ